MYKENAMTKKRIQNPPSLAMRFDKTDKSALVKVASRMGLSQTETVRVLVRERLAKYSKNKNTAKGTR
jgi:hypothetical protein